MGNVRSNPTKRRYEILVEGELAGFTEYTDDAKQRTFTHTEIDEKHQGEGLGQRLVAAALDDTRAQDFAVIPECQFVRKFIESNPSYVDLVPTAERSRFGLEKLAS